MNLDYKEYKFKPFFTIEPDLEPDSEDGSEEYKAGYYSPHLMTNLLYEHYCMIYKTYRIKPENCEILYETDFKTMVRGKLKAIKFYRQRIDIPEELQYSFSASVDVNYGEQFNMYKLKSIVDNRIVNPNPEWLKEEI